METGTEAPRVELPRRDARGNGPPPEPDENYESSRLGFVPVRSVVEAVSDMLERLDLEDRTTLTDPRHYNIRWLELLHEVQPRIERFGSVL